MNKESEKTSSGFDWGKGLTLAIILFIGSTLSVVAYVVSLDYQMVTENHYEKAVNYQQHIDRMEEVGALEQPVRIAYQRQQQVVQIQLPESILNENLQGTVKLYRPNDATKDRTIELLPDENGIQLIPAGDLLRGKWIVKLTWHSGSKNYYQQESIFL